MLNRINVYDLDGTVICSLHRYRTIKENGAHRIDLDHCRANGKHALKDSFLPLAAKYHSDLKYDYIYKVIPPARLFNEPDKFFINNVLG